MNVEKSSKVYVQKMVEHFLYFYIYPKQRSPCMNKTIISVILAAIVIISGAVAFFIMRNHRQLTVED
jgi:hypothetical protein